MKLSTEDVQKIADLARLKVSGEEATSLATQLSSILDYIERLNELDTSNVEPTAHSGAQETPLREDIAVENPAHQVILEQSPDHEGTLFKVPKVI